MATQSGVPDILTRLAAEPLQPKHLYEQIAERLARDIAGGRLEHGERLPAQRDLARALEVSRPSVREAIASLESRGLVETRGGAGSFVCSDAPARARAILASGGLPHDASPLAVLEAREMLEPMVADLAARRAAADERIEELLNVMDSIVDIADPIERRRWSDADRFFHRQLAVASANPLLIEISDTVAAVMDQPLWQTLRDDALADPGRVRLYAAEHRLIYEAVKVGDGEAASFQAREHIRRVRADFIREG